VINLKHYINFLIIFFGDIQIMNLFKYLLLTLCFNIIFADSYLAQSETTEPEAMDIPEEESFEAIDFKDEYLLSLNLGSTIPFGANLKNQFGSGLNLKVNVLTPFGFTMLNKDFKLLAGIDIMKCTKNEDAQYADYSITNFGAKLVTSISILDISMGSGLAMSSGTQMYSINGEYPEYSMTTAYISAGASYTLPLKQLFQKIDLGNLNFDISTLSISLFIEGVEIMGAPSAEGTSDLINTGLSIGYPILL
jgi:hypothetical protein